MGKRQRETNSGRYDQCKILNVRFFPFSVVTPKASKQDTQPLKVRTIEIDRSGAVFLNGRPVALAALREEIRPLNRATPFLIRADRDLALQQFVDVLDTVKNTGFNQVSLQTETRR